MSTGSTAPPIASEKGNIKGAALRHFLVWYARDVGREPIAKAVSCLPPDLRAEIDQGRDGLGLLPSKWYAASAVHALLDALTDGWSKAYRATMAERAARAVMAETLSGVYRALFRALASPTLYARYGQRLWDAHYDTGRSSTTVLSPTQVDSRVSGWAGHHPFLCDLVMAAGLPIYEAMGCKDVRMFRGTCVADGADACTVSFRWKP